MAEFGKVAVADAPPRTRLGRLRMDVENARRQVDRVSVKLPYDGDALHAAYAELTAAEERLARVLP